MSASASHGTLDQNKTQHPEKNRNQVSSERSRTLLTLNMKEYESLFWFVLDPRQEVCSVGGVVGQPGHYAIISCLRSLTMATGSSSSHSTVLIATSQHHTWADYMKYINQIN